MSLLLVNGDAVRIPLADESVHMVCCSPPYWGLRDYGLDERGLGLESTPEQYVANMVAVFREVWRVMRHDATCWINLGDSYIGSPPGTRGKHAQGKEGDGVYKRYWDRQLGHGEDKRAIYRQPPGLKQKDMAGIPWRVAFALQADGWWLRSDIIWSKPNPMPESVTDRPTKAHEYLFLLTKSARYYYDADAVREVYTKPLDRWGGQKLEAKGHSDWDEGTGQVTYRDRDMRPNPAGRNRRTVWSIPTAPYSGAHFATYPPALVEPCIKAGTSERGVCPECGSQWERIIETSQEILQVTNNPGKQDMVTNWDRDGWPRTRKHTTTLGWRPTCECAYPDDVADTGMGLDYILQPYEPVPAVVFDPFAGSGTTLLVARAHGRHGVGIDLSAEYLQLARERLSLDALEDWGTGKKDGKGELTDLPLFEERVT